MESDGNLIRNGIGPEIEQLPMTKEQQRLSFMGWNAMTINWGLRNHDGMSADRVDFAHSATIELQDNQHATGCAACMTGRCARLTHFANDPTYMSSEWTPITYANFDHRGGKRK